ncbi:hypothetical protein PG988_015726 [Apiospora saccharicola]
MDPESHPSSPSGSQFPQGRFSDESARDNEYPDLYTDQDVRWPAIASRQMFYPNAAVHRKFANLTQRILGHFEVQIDCIDQELLKLDRKDAQLGLLGSLPFDRDEFLDRCRGIKHQQQHDYPIQQKQRAVVNQQVRPPVTPELRAQQTNSDHLSQFTAPDQQNHTSRNEGCRQEKTHLLDNAMALLKEYHHFINLNRDFQFMPRVSRKQHLMHYLAVKNEHLPGKAANQYLWARDDFVNTDRDTVHQWFENILYSTSPVFKKRNRDHDPGAPPRVRAEDGARVHQRCAAADPRGPAALPRRERQAGVVRHRLRVDPGLHSRHYVPRDRLRPRAGRALRLCRGAGLVPGEPVW